MRLKNLNTMVSKKINDSEISKTDMASQLGISIQAFNYKYQNGNLEWSEISKLKNLGLDITLKEFSEAMTKDLSSPVVIRRARL